MEDAGHFETASAPLSLQEALNCQIKHIPLKRAFDIVFSLCVMLLGLPLYLIIALVIAFTSKGKIIYSHERIGRGGIPFKCYKFRTMRKNSEEYLKRLLEKEPALKEEWERNHKLKTDPRVTLTGLFLRKTSLDELPQFYNVLRGDLSVVGPRPVVKTELIKFYQFKAAKILSVRPGLTGVWQVSGRSDTSYQTRILLDERYIDNQSLKLDLELIVKTIPAMIKSKGAY
jgi:exopolysaccharide production protein ExoY